MRWVHGGGTASRRPAGAFGPRLQALIALFTGMFELSRWDVVEVMRTVLDVDLCLGSVQGCCEDVSEAIAPTVQEVHADLKASPVVHADETSFGFLDGHHRWLWILASGDSEVFLLQEGRGQQEAIALLGPGFKGVLIRDRWRPYEIFDGFGKAASQLCHAHLRREFKALAEAEGVTQAMGKALLEASDRMFHDWHRLKNGELSRRQFQKNMMPIQETFLDAFERAPRPSMRLPSRAVAVNEARRNPSHPGVMPGFTLLPHGFPEEPEKKA